MKSPLFSICNWHKFYKLFLTWLHLFILFLIEICIITKTEKREACYL